MAKPGPKRKRNVKRFPCGQIAKVDPLPGVIARRIASFVIAGVKTDDKIDIRLGESWLGVLFAAKAISQVQFDAGNKYHHLYKACLPQGFPGSAQDPDAPRIGDVLVQPYEVFNCPTQIVESWKASERVLEGLGRRTHALVKNICVYERFQRFIDTSSPRPMTAWKADSKDKTRFLCGLDALVLAYSMKTETLEQKVAAISANTREQIGDMAYLNLFGGEHRYQITYGDDRETTEQRATVDKRTPEQIQKYNEYVKKWRASHGYADSEWSP